MQRTRKGWGLAAPGHPSEEGGTEEVRAFTWSELVADLSAGLKRVVEAAEADLEALEEAFPARPPAPSPSTLRQGASLEATAAAHRTLTEEILRPALGRLDSTPPGRRLTSALERLARSLDQAVDRVPIRLPRTNASLEGLPGRPIRERPKARPLAAREVARGQVSMAVESLLRQAREAVADLDLLAMKGLQDWRRDCLGLERPVLSSLLVRAATRSLRVRPPQDPLAGLRRQVARLEEQWGSRLRRALLSDRNAAAPSGAARQRLLDAVEVASTELALEAELERLWSGLQGLLAGWVAVANRQDSACRQEARDLARILQQACEPGAEPKVPVAASVLTGAIHHLENLTRKVEAFAQSAPQDLIRATAGRRPLAFHSTPTREFLRAFQAALPRLHGALEDLLARLEELSREAQRARELLDYSRDSEGFQAEVDLAAEALQSQALNLERMEARLPPAGASLSPLAAEVLSDVTWEVRLALDRCPRLAADFRLRLSANRLRNRLESLAQSTARSGLERSWQTLKTGSHRALVNLGWMPATTEGRPQVEVRPAMPGDDSLAAARSILPATYKRLFRPVPVEDPRFLVGRSLELEALGAARAAWEAGRPTAVMIRGARGSGKTSLLNCALKGVLEGLPVQRIQPRERICTEVGLQEWMQNQSLLQGRRVVILEEAERLYLRRIGGFEALEGLLRTLHSTQPEVLWIVVLNLYAASLLQAACGLESAFTHRLHAETVGPAELREAIMVRHRLSGLRLRFLDGQARDPARHRWFTLSPGPEDPEAVFFADLHRHSGGVFRSAMEIWLDSIEPAERGTLTVRPLDRSDLSRVVEDLATEGHFTLVAVLQHGSLTAAEHAEVFSLPEAVSRAGLLDLVGRRLLEEDPEHPGFRVRPEARPPVRQVLYRLNLL